MIELESVQKTLLLPLWGRAVETRKAHPRLEDRAAADIIASVDYDFSTIAANISPLTRLGWIARSLHTDRTTREFLATHAGATIVNIGCGLDTTFERVDDGRLRWYDLDLPDVIELRRGFIADSDRRRSIACSVLDETWMDQVPADGAVLFIAAGVFYYFEEAKIRSLLRRFAGRFSGAEVLFDACSPRGLRLANTRVIKAGGMDQSAILRWGLRRAADIESWDPRIRVLDDYPIFRNLRRTLPVRARIATVISDFLRIMFMVHLRV